MPEAEFGGKYRVLAALIRERRRELNLSQREAVAELKRARSGFDRSIWRRWEKGDAAPSRFWLPRVAAVLQLPVSTLREARTLPRHRPAARPAEDLADSASYVERHDPPSSLRRPQAARSESPEILHTRAPQSARTVTSEADVHLPVASPSGASVDPCLPIRRSTATVPAPGTVETVSVPTSPSLPTGTS